MKAGMVIINKEKGDTSQTVVSKVKKILQAKKAGHTGTLDPLATGVLPVLLEEATKLSKYLIEHDKTYVATIQLGEKRETGDEEGKIIEEATVGNLVKEKIEFVFSKMQGKQKQIPPKYSAVKINGKKLYEYARAGQTVEIPAREIEIYKIQLLKLNQEEKQITFEVSCSKGTYIRVLCEDIAEKLGTVGYMKCLRRTEVDEFKIEQAVALQDLTQKDIISVEKLCEKYETIELDKRKLELFLNGVKLTVKKKDGVYRVFCEQTFMGLGIVEKQRLKRDVIVENITN